MIPKIIHHTAPSDINRWHDIWSICRQSWKNNFLDFEFKLWNDEDNRNLVKSDYSDFLSMYDSFPHHIMKVDFIRFCILHKFGGFYADMDIFCYKNFYDILTKDICIIESWPEWKELIQNSLMISVPNNNFWIDCMEKTKKFYEDNIQLFHLHQRLSYNSYVELCFRLAGPKLISSLFETYKNEIQILPKEFFNPIVEHQFNWIINKPFLKNETFKQFQKINKSENLVYTRHYLTGKWTENIIDRE
jgi:hypothetical protein